MGPSLFQETYETQIDMKLIIKHTKTYTLKPLSGRARRAPVKLPLICRNVPLFKAIALPMPPIVSPVESVMFEGIRPNPTIP